MHSIKTHSGASKRFKITASGKVKRKNTNKRHLLRKRSTKRKRHLDIDSIVRHCDFNNVKLQLVIKSPRAEYVKFKQETTN